MKILGIDTATQILNLAIIENSKVIYDYRMNKEGTTHSGTLIPFIENIINFAGFKLCQLDGIATAIGPGSFTGLRIGLASAKGLAFALSIPLIGVNTLEAYALQWKDLPGTLCPIIKARKDEYYFTIYQKSKRNNRLIKKVEYQCKKWINIKEQLLMFETPFFIFGYGIEDVFQENISSKNFKDKYIILKKEEPPGASYIALIGEDRIIKNKYDDMYALSPFYICKSAAERNKYSANNKGLQNEK